MNEIVGGIRLLVYLGFAGLGLCVATAAGEAHRRATNGLLVYVLSLSLLAGFAQRDAWPFATHASMAEDSSVEPWRWSYVRLLDADGREWVADAEAWSPLSHLRVHQWLSRVGSQLPESQQREAAAYLLERAEEARQLRWQGHSLGTERWLRGLAAPHRFRFRVDSGRPERPFAALRIYTMTWRPSKFGADPGRMTRKLALEQSR